MPYPLGNTATLTILATNAAQYLGVLDSGESLTATQIADALSIVNIMLDSWSSDVVMIPYLNRSSSNMVAGQQDYTVGPGSPVGILSAELVLSSGPSSPVKVLSIGEWNSLPDREARSWHQRFCFYNPTEQINPGVGNSTLSVSPVPLGSGSILSFWGWNNLAQFADATTPYLIPRGYWKPITLSLAHAMIDQYRAAKWTDSLQAEWSNCMATIRNLNARLLGIEPPSGQVGAFAGAPVAPESSAA